MKAVKGTRESKTFLKLWKPVWEHAEFLPPATAFVAVGQSCGVVRAQSQAKCRRVVLGIGTQTPAVASQAPSVSAI